MARHQDRDPQLLDHAERALHVVRPQPRIQRTGHQHGRDLRRVGRGRLQHHPRFFAYRLHFGGRGGPQFSILILWWLILVAIATYILLRTRTGNWILASGGNAASARAVGVPTKWVKIGLFMFVGFSAWFYAMHQLSAYKSVQAGSGIGGEFLYIIAAVVGGCALTGGSGSAIGSAIGAFIYGMTVQGIVYAGWDPNWFRFFLGVMLLGAVLLNLKVKQMSARIRR